MLRLAHEEMRMIIPIEENTIPVFVVEQPLLFRTMIAQLAEQQDGAEGKFVLSEEWSPLSIAKNVMLLTDLFSLDCNDRRLLNALYKQLASSAVGNAMSLETLNMRSALTDWMGKLEMETRYPLRYSSEPDISSVLKMLEVRFEDASDSLLEKFARLLCLYAEYLHVKLFIGVHLHSFFSDHELRQLYAFAMAQKLNILLMENTVPQVKLKGERIFVIDKDLCELYDE